MADESTEPRDVKTRLKEELVHMNELYAPNSAIQVRVSQDELKELLSGGVPPGMEDLKKASEFKPTPSHVLLWREQVQQILDYENRKKTT